MFSQPFDPENAASEAGFNPVLDEGVELLSEEDYAEFDENPQGWGENPITRAVALGLVLLGGGGLAAFAFLLPRGGEQAKQDESSNPIAILKDQNQQLQRELAKVRAENALAQQSSAAEGQAGRGEPELQNPPEALPPESSPVVTRPVTAPKPLPVALQPTVVPVAQSLPVSQPLVSRSTVAIPKSLPAHVPSPKPLPQRAATPVAVAPALTRVSVPQPVAVPEPSPDADTVLAELQNLGSYGEGNQLESPVAVAPVSLSPSVSAPSNAVIQTVANENASSVVAGTIASAKLDAPIVWSSQNPEPTVVVTLTEPLGEVSAGAKLKGVAHLEQDTGLALIALTAVIHNSTEQPLPGKAVIAIGENNQPLVAEAYPKQQSSPLRGVQGTIVRGLAQGLANEFTSEIENDIVNGVVEESVDEVLGNLEERPQPSNTSTALAWTIPQGLSLKLIVNHSFSVDDAVDEVTPAVASLPELEPELVILPVPEAVELVTHSTNTRLPEPLPFQIALPEPVTPEPVAVEFTPTVVDTSPMLANETQFINDATQVKVWPGSGTNISFLQTGERITRAWLDDPTMVTLQFDEPLCESASPNCASGQPSVVHLRWINEGLEYDHLPSVDRTLLTLMTLTQSGEERLHVFQVERGEGEPIYHTIQVQPLVSPQPVPQTAITALEPPTISDLTQPFVDGNQDVATTMEEAFVEMEPSELLTADVPVNPL